MSKIKTGDIKIIIDQYRHKNPKSEVGNTAWSELAVLLTTIKEQTERIEQLSKTPETGEVKYKIEKGFKPEEKQRPSEVRDVLIGMASGDSVVVWRKDLGKFFYQSKKIGKRIRTFKMSDDFHRVFVV